MTGDAVRAYVPHAEQALRHVFFVDRRYFVVLDELAAPEPVPFQWLLHARSAMQLMPEDGALEVRAGDARLAVQFLFPTPEGLSLTQRSTFDPPVDPGWRGKMPDEWHVTAETPAARRQDFLTVLYPWSAVEGNVPHRVRRVQTVDGYALRVGDEALVLMAKEVERRVEASGWVLEGMAASLTHAEGVQRFALVDASRFEGAWMIRAERPVNAEGRCTSAEMSLRVQVEAPRVLTIRPPFSVRTVLGAETWHKAPDGSVRITVSAGSAHLVLRP